MKFVKWNQYYLHASRKLKLTNLIAMFPFCENFRKYINLGVHKSLSTKFLISLFIDNVTSCYKKVIIQFYLTRKFSG